MMDALPKKSSGSKRLSILRTMYLSHGHDVARAPTPAPSFIHFLVQVCDLSSTNYTRTGQKQASQSISYDNGLCSWMVSRRGLQVSYVPMSYCSNHNGIMMVEPNAVQWLCQTETTTTSGHIMMVSRCSVGTARFGR